MNLERLYVACHIHELTGLALVDFEANPALGLALAHQEDACASIRAGFRPLLPAQVRAIRALEDASPSRDMEGRPEGPMEGPHGRPTPTVVPYAVFRRRRATRMRA